MKLGEYETGQIGTKIIISFHLIRVCHSLLEMSGTLFL